MPNQIMHIPSRYLNDFASDYPGETTVDALGQSRFLDQVGKFYYADAKDAFRLSKTSVGTLYGGNYQLVKTAAVLTIPATKGIVAFWTPTAIDDNPSTFEVDSDASTGASLIAGVFLQTVGASKYTFIQVSGIATVLFQIDLTKDTALVDAAIGDLVVVAASTSRGDVLADATTLTSVEARHILGVAVEAPADVAITGGLYKVCLTFQTRVF